jgi:hypothetical protein
LHRDSKSGKRGKLRDFTSRLRTYILPLTLELTMQGCAGDLYESVGEISQYKLNEEYTRELAKKEE